MAIAIVQCVDAQRGPRGGATPGSSRPGRSMGADGGHPMPPPARHNANTQGALKPPGKKAAHQSGGPAPAAGGKKSHGKMAHQRNAQGVPPPAKMAHHQHNSQGVPPPAKMAHHQKNSQGVPPPAKMAHHQHNSQGVPPPAKMAHHQKNSQGAPPPAKAAHYEEYESQEDFPEYDSQDVHPAMRHEALQR